MTLTLLQDEKQAAIEKAIEEDAIFQTPTPVPGADATWMEAKEQEAHNKENMQYADIKRDLREKIRDMRRQVSQQTIHERHAPQAQSDELSYEHTCRAADYACGAVRA